MLQQSREVATKLSRVPSQGQWHCPLSGSSADAFIAQCFLDGLGLDAYPFATSVFISCLVAMK